MILGSEVLKKVKRKGNGSTCVMVLHLQNWFGSNMSTRLHCFVVCLQLSPMKHNRNRNGYGEEWWRGLTGPTSIIHVPCISCWNLVCCQDASQKLAVRWMNELLRGKQSTVTYFFVYSSVMGRIRYLLCTWNTVKIYKSNIVWTQWIYCAFADCLLHVYFVEMQATCHLYLVLE